MTGWPSESMMRYSPSGTDSVAMRPASAVMAASVGFASDLASARTRPPGLRRVGQMRNGTRLVAAFVAVRTAFWAARKPRFGSVRVRHVDARHLAARLLDVPVEPMRYAVYVCPVSVPPDAASSSIVASVSAMAAGAAPIASNAASAVAVIILMFAIALFSLVSSRPVVPVGSKSMAMP